MGNSEVGHMTIGSGRILYQNLVKITKAIEEDTLKDNPVITSMLSKCRDLHIVGLLSDGGVHSHIDHLIALAKIGEANGKLVHLHLITDGRDVSPVSAPEYVAQIEAIENEKIKIATIGGRFYTMDRDKRWERVEKGYNAIAKGLPKTDLSPMDYVKESHKKDILDEFIDPACFGGYNGFEDNDGVIFANFRSDRMREIVEVCGDANFSEFERNHAHIHIATMTQYNKAFSYPIIFEDKTPTNTLAEVISKAGLNQLHTSETEKYAHVTFFLNGGVEEPFLNETRVLVPSPNVKTYDMKPEMSAADVGENIRAAMDEGYDFIVANFANGDMVGHTGVYDAGVKAVEAVDIELGKIIELCKELGYNFVLTSDHGNCEQMKDPKNGKTLTNHTTFDVYCFIMAEGVKKVEEGGLNNIAPTVLKLMDVEIPAEMDAPLV